ncbi:hypothetical protein [Thauera humireducens]|uniref:hypothetical protein n=1 Tax=Thauera humireducens TaxID=1134435 RepID=UPI00311FAEC7
MRQHLLHAQDATTHVGGLAGLDVLLDEVEVEHGERGLRGLGADAGRQGQGQAGKPGEQAMDGGSWHGMKAPLRRPIDVPLVMRMRHGVLRWLGGTMLGLLAAAASADLVRSVEVAPGNHVLIGSRNEASRQNHGEVGNLGFIVGDDAVLVVNAGTSYVHGRQLLARVAEEAPGRRMAMLVLTQPLPEFVLGAAAFSDQGIPVVAHEAASRLLSQRCEQCLENPRAAR